MTTIEQVVAVATKNNRVCPMPQKWLQLYNLLPDRTRREAGAEPALPLILGAWGHTSAIDKMLRLQEHIAWAEQHGALEQVRVYLESLPEQDWHHVGE